MQEAARDVLEPRGQAAHLEQLAARVIGRQAPGYPLVVVVTADAVTGPAQLVDEAGDLLAGGIGGDELAPAHELAVV